MRSSFALPNIETPYPPNTQWDVESGVFFQVILQFFHYKLRTITVIVCIFAKFRNLYAKSENHTIREILKDKIHNIVMIQSIGCISIEVLV